MKSPAAFPQGRGDILRSNRDGTLFLRTGSNKAVVHVMIVDTADGSVLEVYNGPATSLLPTPPLSSPTVGSRGAAGPRPGRHRRAL